MTNNDKNELTAALLTARAVHGRMQGATIESVAIGALIRAVELLAGEQVQEPTERPTVTFDEGLVERLARVAWNVRAAYLPNAALWDDALLPRDAEKITRTEVHAILTELASMPCELPTDDGLVERLANVAAKQSSWNDAVRAILAELAPILAAKDAEIARLKALQDDSAAFDSDPAAESRKLQTHIAELEKRLADATSVPVVDGKTPGDVLHAARKNEWVRRGSKVSAIPERTQTMIEVDEQAALAVLRAFGGEALRRVRERVLGKLEDESEEYVLAVIDDALTNLGAQTKTDACQSEMLVSPITGERPWNQCQSCGTLNNPTVRGDFGCDGCGAIISGPPLPKASA